MPTKEGGRTGPSDPRSKQTAKGAQNNPRRSYGGVDAEKPKKDLYEDAQKAGIEGRSTMTKHELADALQRYNDRETRRARERS